MTGIEVESRLLLRTIVIGGRRQRGRGAPSGVPSARSASVWMSPPQHTLGALTGVD